MDRSVPAAAAAILAFIYKGESGGDYNKMSAGAEKRFGKKITSMSINDVLAAFDSSAERNALGMISSAVGAPQFINKTLAALKAKLGLSGKEKLNADMQDRLAYQLLRDRGYDAWVSGRIDTVEFAKRLAQEWASLPVLAGTKNAKGKNIRRGSGYYDGDGLNSAKHVSADIFEHVLEDALANKQVAVLVTPASTKPVATTKYVAAASTAVAVVGGANEAAQTVTDWSPVIELASTVGRYGPIAAAVIVGGIAAVVIAKKVWK
ncbi:transmembrane-domain-containing SAR endolysin transglycosylase [Rhizobium phage Palo]|uniref:Transmembrane-domain-containing SAR endolysin transglycosylase n=1 Tax=Rhizobium phage Palo TaxID=2767573 RepID=A0A7L8G4I5_9CAUD|nr:transmembrane-domain-containing SAR endolysin transglycosylase [Rhizobium phage Palo]